MSQPSMSVKDAARQWQEASQRKNNDSPYDLSDIESLDDYDDLDSTREKKLLRKLEKNMDRSRDDISVLQMPDVYSHLSVTRSPSRQSYTSDCSDLISEAVSIPLSLITRKNEVIPRKVSSNAQNKRPEDILELRSESEEIKKLKESLKLEQTQKELLNTKMKGLMERLDQLDNVALDQIANQAPLKSKPSVTERLGDVTSPSSIFKQYEAYKRDADIKVEDLEHQLREEVSKTGRFTVLKMENAELIVQLGAKDVIIATLNSAADSFESKIQEMSVKKVDAIHEGELGYVMQAKKNILLKEGLSDSNRSSSSSKAGSPLVDRHGKSSDLHVDLLKDATIKRLTLDLDIAINRNLKNVELQSQELLNEHDTYCTFIQNILAELSKVQISATEKFFVDEMMRNAINNATYSKVTLHLSKILENNQKYSSLIQSKAEHSRADEELLLLRTKITESKLTQAKVQLEAFKEKEVLMKNISIIQQEQVEAKEEILSLHSKITDTTHNLAKIQDENFKTTETMIRKNSVVKAGLVESETRGESMVIKMAELRAQFLKQQEEQFKEMDSLVKNMAVIRAAHGDAKEEMAILHTRLLDGGVNLTKVNDDHQREISELQSSLTSSMDDKVELNSKISEAKALGFKQQDESSKEKQILIKKLSQAQGALVEANDEIIDLKNRSNESKSYLSKQQEDHFNDIQALIEQKAAVTGELKKSNDEASASGRVSKDLEHSIELWKQKYNTIFLSLQDANGIVSANERSLISSVDKEKNYQDQILQLMQEVAIIKDNFAHEKIKASDWKADLDQQHLETLKVANTKRLDASEHEKLIQELAEEKNQSAHWRKSFDIQKVTTTQSEFNRSQISEKLTDSQHQMHLFEVEIQALMKLNSDLVMSHQHAEAGFQTELELAKQETKSSQTRDNSHGTVKNAIDLAHKIKIDSLKEELHSYRKSEIDMGATLAALELSKAEQIEGLRVDYNALLAAKRKLESIYYELLRSSESLINELDATKDDLRDANEVHSQFVLEKASQDSAGVGLTVEREKVFAKRQSVFDAKEHELVASNSAYQVLEIKHREQDHAQTVLEQKLELLQAELGKVRFKFDYLNQAQSQQDLNTQSLNSQLLGKATAERQYLLDIKLLRQERDSSTIEIDRLETLNRILTLQNSKITKAKEVYSKRELESFEKQSSDAASVDRLYNLERKVSVIASKLEETLVVPIKQQQESSRQHVRSRSLNQEESIRSSEKALEKIAKKLQKEFRQDFERVESKLERLFEESHSLDAERKINDGLLRESYNEKLRYKDNGKSRKSKS